MPKFKMPRLENKVLKYSPLVFTTAAKMLANETPYEMGCCEAIERAFRSIYGRNCNRKHLMLHREMFKEYFDIGSYERCQLMWHPNEFGGAFWWGKLTKKNQRRRVTALLMAAHIARADNKETALYIHGSNMRLGKLLGYPRRSTR